MPLSQLNPVTSVGVVLGFEFCVLTLFPNCPEWLPPQQKNPPEAIMAQLCAEPAAKRITFDKPGTEVGVEFSAVLDPAFVTTPSCP